MERRGRHDDEGKVLLIFCFETCLPQSFFCKFQFSHYSFINVTLLSLYFKSFQCCFHSFLKILFLIFTISNLCFEGFFLIFFVTYCKINMNLRVKKWEKSEKNYNNNNNKKIALVIVKDKIETFKNYMSNIETF